MNADSTYGPTFPMELIIGCCEFVWKLFMVFHCQFINADSACDTTI